MVGEGGGGGGGGGGQNIMAIIKMTPPTAEYKMLPGLPCLYIEWFIPIILFPCL